MKTKYLEHSFGGRILSIDSIQHATQKDGENKGQAYWEFKGHVQWSDGTESRGAYIAPYAIAYDHDNEKAKIESQLVFEKLSDYMLENGQYSQKKGLWVPHEKEGSAPV